ncbi:MAG: hypothetical protein P0S95_07070 [Rhabdochlamydiaceae bacterium]|nr:hypothetical protein [Candidatus Amphrikana amoebophyrae]
MHVISPKYNDELLKQYFNVNDPDEVQSLDRWHGFAYRLEIVLSDIIGSVVGIISGVANTLTGRRFIVLNNINVVGMQSFGSLVPHIFMMMQNLMIPSLTILKVRVINREGHLKATPQGTGQDESINDLSIALTKACSEKMRIYNPFEHAESNNDKTFWQVRQIAIMSAGALLVDEIKSLFFTVLYGVRFIGSTTGHILDSMLVGMGRGKTVNPIYWKNMNKFNEAFLVALNLKPAITAGFYAMNILFVPPKPVS